MSISPTLVTTTAEFYSELARQIAWYKTAKGEFVQQAEDKIAAMEKQLPYGSGFNNGSHVDFEKSTGEKIVIDTAFHHMDENGYYDGWTEHKVIVVASLMYGFRLKVTGKDRNRIKDYIAEQFLYIIK